MLHQRSHLKMSIYTQHYIQQLFAIFVFLVFCFWMFSQHDTCSQIYKKVRKSFSCPLCFFFFCLPPFYTIFTLLHPICNHLLLQLCTLLHSPISTFLHFSNSILELNSLAIVFPRVVSFHHCTNCSTFSTFLFIVKLWVMVICLLLYL